MQWGEYFARGLKYRDFLEKYGTAEQQRKWQAVHQQVQLSPSQIELLHSFKRSMKVICLAGTWCGDCVEQCPIFDHFTQQAPCIDLRFFDRDEHPELASELSMCGGARVPAVQFLNEDDQPIGRYGDRTLAKYRQMVARLDGAACPTGLVVDKSLLQQVTEDWLNEFERLQWMLRTSPRLREKHGD